MIIASVVVVCLVLFIILCKHLEDGIGRLFGKVSKLIKWTKHLDDRISSLEVKDTSQDMRLDQHDQRFGEDERAVRMLSKEVGELGQDIGWDDDCKKTQELKLPDPDDSNT